MRNGLLNILAHVALCLFVVLAAGCASSEVKPSVQTVIQPPPLFPPQEVIQSGDYAGFLATNQEILKSCPEPEQCAAALFNVAFLYCYPRSPYFNPVRGIKYLDDLMQGAPGTPWAYQAQVWSDLVKKVLVLQKIARKPKPKGEAKPRDTAEEESTQQSEVAPESVPVMDLQPQEPETDRQALEEQIKAKDATIKELNRRIERSRQIDIEIEKKERGLLF